MSRTTYLHEETQARNGLYWRQQQGSEMIFHLELPNGKVIKANSFYVDRDGDWTISSAAGPAVYGSAGPVTILKVTHEQVPWDENEGFDM